MPTFSTDNRLPRVTTVSHDRGMSLDQPKARRAAPSDMDEVLRLAGLMFSTIGQDPSPQWRRIAARSFAELGEDVAAFVVDHPDEPGRLVASCAGAIVHRLPAPKNPSGLAGYVQWVATDPEFRRQGLSTAVISELLDWYRERGVSRVELHATPAGAGVYSSLGFSTGDYPGMLTYV